VCHFAPQFGLCDEITTVEASCANTSIGVKEKEEEENIFFES
jgi:hypothetical protein